MSETWASKTAAEIVADLDRVLRETSDGRDHTGHAQVMLMDYGIVCECDVERAGIPTVMVTVEEAAELRASGWHLSDEERAQIVAALEKTPPTGAA